MNIGPAASARACLQTEMTGTDNMYYVPSMFVLYFLFHRLVCSDVVVSAIAAIHGRTVSSAAAAAAAVVIVACGDYSYIRISAAVLTHVISHSLSLFTPHNQAVISR